MTDKDTPDRIYAASNGYWSYKDYKSGHEAFNRVEYIKDSKVNALVESVNAFIKSGGYSVVTVDAETAHQSMKDALNEYKGTK